MVLDEGYDLLGYRALVSAPTAAIRKAIRAVLRGFGPIEFETTDTIPRYELSQSTRFWRIQRDTKSLQIEPTLDGAIGLLEWHLVAAALNHRADLVHLHAAALADPTGNGSLLLIGKSGAGKTTLTLGLMLRGFNPFCDDVTLIDPASLAPLPLRRAFHVNERTWQMLAAVCGSRPRRDPDAPGDYFVPARFANHHAPVRWIFLIDRKPGAQPDLVPLSPSETAAAVLASSSTLEHASRVALSTCARLAERAACFRFVAGDLGPSLDALQNLVDSTAASMRS